MARVANYELFRDASFGLKIGDDIDRTLTANIENTPVSGEGAVAMWKARREGSGSVSYRVIVNGTQVYSTTTDEPNITTIHEVLNTPDISKGENTVKFEVTGGTGTLRVADVMIWYRQNV